MSQTREKSMTEDRRTQRRTNDERWRTALTRIEPNKIILRGYPLDEIMGRLTFGETIYLLLMGEIPSPALGRLMEAVLVSFIDHGATPPSTLAARNTATTGAALRACVAAGILGFGKYHGGDIESCMQFLDTGLELVRKGASYRSAAEQIVQRSVEAKEIPPGFGHRFHTRDPRAARLFQMALELEAEAEHIQMIRAVENVLHEKPGTEALAGQYRWRNRRGLRRYRDSADGRQRALHHLPRTRDRGARRRRARASAADAADRSEGPHLRRPIRTPAAGEAQVGKVR